MNVKAVIFDFGGVLADEGFRDGLRAIGVKHGLDPELVFRTGRELAFGGGYVTGNSDEPSFWRLFRERTGLPTSVSDYILRTEILDRFRLRLGMLELVDRIRESGYITAILSDQTNWLDELNSLYRFALHFDKVFNSYAMGQSKAEPSVFGHVCSSLGVRPDEALFIDDSEGNIIRALDAGLQVMLFMDEDCFKAQILTRLKGLSTSGKEVCNAAR